MKKNNIALIGIAIVIVLSILFIESQKDPVNRGSEIFINDSSQRVLQKQTRYPGAIELVNPEGYINTDYITIADNIGEKVILIDFWTYSCINCQRTFPYLTSWYEKYKDDGLVIIGIHSPEFEFEEDYDNVKKAVEKYSIEYPVVQDNDHETWRAYQNRYWPRKYLIDIDGFIVYDHIGEGAYEETEMKIQELLEERKLVLESDVDIEKGLSYPDAENPEFRSIGTPELYFGYGFRRGNFGNSEGFSREKEVSYEIPVQNAVNNVYLSGSWLNKYDYMETKSDSKVLLTYFAKKVNIVAGSDNNAELNILLDGQQHDAVTVKDHDLYTIIDGDDYSLHTLEIELPENVKMYTFTFG